MAHISESDILGIKDLPPGLTVGNSAVMTTHSEERIKGWKNNRNLVLLILDALVRSRKTGRALGKNELIDKAKEKGMSVSDYQMRKLLHELDYEGWVHIGSTSQGTVITDKGLHMLPSLSEELRDSLYRDCRSQDSIS